MTDNVNQPAHYILANGHQVIEVSENLTSNGGQAVQYIARATRTDGVVKGDPIEDLRKAVWFIEREIGRLTPEPQQTSWTISDVSKLREQLWGTREHNWEVVVGPRRWYDLDSVPPNTVVVDREGDQWKRVGGTNKFKLRRLEYVSEVQYAAWKDAPDWLMQHRNGYAPFTEVTDG